MNNIDRTEQSLCWRCSNSVPSKTHGCSWSREFKPVTGWDAKSIPRVNYKVPGVSYIVRECPLFDDEGYESLGKPIAEQRRQKK